MNLSRCMILRLVAIHELPAMRLVLPAFVCSVGSRVVAMDANLFGSRCSFMLSPINPPSGYAFALVVPFAPLRITDVHPQEKQRTCPWRSRSASGMSGGDY